MACLKKVKTFPRKISLSSGFTIIEVLIVMFIIALVAGATLPSFGTHSRRQTLKLQTKRLKTDIRTAQSRAVGGYKNPRGGPTDAAAWGIHIRNDSNSYSIFSCKSDAASSTYTYSPQCVNFYEETKTFPSPIKVTALTFVPLPSADRVNIIFDVITGKVFFNEDDGDRINLDEVKITLNYPSWGPLEERTIRVTKGGNIEDYFLP